MKNIILTISLFLWSLPAFSAEQVKLNVAFNYYTDNEAHSLQNNTSVVVNYGEEVVLSAATFENRKVSISSVAQKISDKTGDKIKIEFFVKENGKVLASPQLITMLGDEAEVSAYSDDENYSLKVTALEI